MKNLRKIIRESLTESVNSPQSQLYDRMVDWLKTGNEADHHFESAVKEGWKFHPEEMHNPPESAVPHIMQFQKHNEATIAKRKNLMAFAAEHGIGDEEFHRIKSMAMDEADEDFEMKHGYKPIKPDFYRK